MFVFKCCVFKIIYIEIGEYYIDIFKYCMEFFNILLLVFKLIDKLDNVLLI